MTQRTFDVQRSADPNNARFPVRAVLEPKPLRSYTWSLGLAEPLDQGNRGHCVGMGCGHELAARPAVVLGVTHSTGVRIHDLAQHRDEFAETPPEDGTSINAGAKVLREWGALTSWLWCPAVHDVALALGYKGPVVIAVPWHTGQMQTTGGYIFPTGQVEGWHCVLLNSFSTRSGDFRGVNSWGTDFGDRGTFKIAWDDLEQLWSEGGQGWVAVGRKVITVPT